MATRNVSPGQTEQLTVAPGAPVGTAETVEARRAVAEKFARSFGSALEEATARRARPEAGAIGPGFVAGLEWNVLSAGPFLLSGITAPAAPPARPNRVVPSGAELLMLGISWAANPLTIGYLSSKEYSARFETVNMSTVAPGPSVTMAGPAFSFGAAAAGPPISGVIPIGAFHLFFWLFAPTVPGGPGTTTQLLDINFSIDIKPFGVPDWASAGGAFCEWHWDPDSTSPMPNPIGLAVTPGTAAGWRYGYSNRVAVFPYPG